MSGGLDSTLAAKIVKEQGIDVIGLKFKIPFSTNSIQKSADLEIREIDISEKFLKILLNPRYGYGSRMNPCIDCKILMLNKARELMDEWGAKFIITGEVLGQRPMSQYKQALMTIAKRADLEGLVLRPLSAKLLPETLPEKEGWIKRENLLAFSGRGRKNQIELAKTLGIKEYNQPAGGCLLTDPEFSRRLKELITHNELNLNNIELLKIGRHFRISPEAKLIVGRNREENMQLINFGRENDYLFYPPDDLAGPTSLGKGKFNEELLKLSCSITSRYCDLNDKREADMIFMKIPKKEEKRLHVSSLEDNWLLTLRI
jgi:tRNA U34 2-thiouridine synthase MnmA/TrmU